MAKARDREFRQYPLGPDMGYEAGYSFQGEELPDALNTALSELGEAVASHQPQGSEKQSSALTRYQQYNNTVRFLASTYPQRFHFFRGGYEADPVEQRLINTTNYLASQYRGQGSYQAPIFSKEDIKRFAEADQAAEAQHSKGQAPILGIPVAVFLAVGIGVAVVSPIGGGVICGFALIFLVLALTDYFSTPSSRELNYQEMVTATEALALNSPTP